MKKVIWISALGSFLLFLFAGYYFTLKTAEKDYGQASVKTEKTILSKQTIGENTKLICRYFYTTDRVTKERMEMAPAFLYGLDMEQMKSSLKGWEIIRFSSDRVIMRTVIDGLSTEAYLIGELDGNIAVYNDDVEKGPKLKEKTDIPITVLPVEEAEKIRKGIHVNGEETLTKLLSDYSS